MKKRARIDFFDVLLGFVVLVFLGAFFMLILTISFPDVSQRILHSLRQRADVLFGEGKTESAGEMITGLGNRAIEGYNFRIRPFFKETTDTIFKPKKVKKRKAALLPNEAFSKCVQCHQQLFDKPSTGLLLVDHQLHYELKISCGFCHQGSSLSQLEKHQSQVKTSGSKSSGKVTTLTRVTKGTCIDCHRSEKASEQCKSCHPPGSIFDPQISDVSSVNKFFSFKEYPSLVPPAFHGGRDIKPCTNCHDVPQFCERCHMVQHNDAFVAGGHGPNILNMTYTINACQQCHDYIWCAEKCHRNPGKVRVEQRFVIPGNPAFPAEPWLERVKK